MMNNQASYPKVNQDAIETVVCFLMAEFGPDGHTDGSDVVAYGVLKALGYNVEYPEDSWNKKESVDSEIASALSYHPDVCLSPTTMNPSIDADKANRRGSSQLGTPRKAPDKEFAVTHRGRET